MLPHLLLTRTRTRANSLKDGTEYALTADVAVSLGITVSRLLELHPTLPWRTATLLEKKEIAAQGLASASFVTLINIAEVSQPLKYVN